MNLAEAYLVLGLPDGATDAEVREAHREISRLVHPDKHGGDERLRLRAETMQKRANQARKVIQDAGFPASDAARKAAAKPAPQPAPSAQRPPRKEPPRSEPPRSEAWNDSRKQDDQESSRAHRRSDPRPIDVDAIREGQIIGQYKVIHRLARGFDSSVFRVEHTSFGKVLALKILRDHASDAAQRFLTSIRNASGIQHRNVVELSTFAAADGLMMSVMEYIPGVPLDQWWSVALPLERSISTFIQVCEGLAAIHEKRVVHLSLKPGHVLVYPQRGGFDLPKILDFSAARDLTPNLRMQGVYNPTTCAPQYMSPEQAADQVMDARSDIYSVGALMYECFSGEPVFRAATVDDYRRMHQSATPSSPRRTTKGRAMDPTLESIIIKCLEKSPARRYQSALDLRDALASIPLARAERDVPRTASEAEPKEVPPKEATDRAASGGVAAPGAVPSTRQPVPSSPGTTLTGPALGLLAWLGIFAFLAWNKRGCEREGTNGSSVNRPAATIAAVPDAGPHFSCLRNPPDGIRLCAGPGYVPRDAGPDELRAEQSAWCVQNRISWADPRSIMVCVVTKQECEEHLVLAENGNRSLFNRRECYPIAPSEWFGEPVPSSGRPDAFVCKFDGTCQGIPGDLITDEDAKAQAWCYSSPKEPGALLSCFASKKSCAASRKARRERDPCVLEGPSRSLQSYASTFGR